MKSKIFKTLAIAVLPLMSFVSCNDYLTEVDPNEVTTNSYWENLDDTQAGIYATMAAMRNEYFLNIRHEAWRSDMGWPGYGRPQPQDNSDGWSWYTQQYTSSSTGVIEKWDAIYTGIWRANQTIEALEALEDFGGDQDEWTYQMAQCRFLRGMYYFFLHSAYNGGSVVLRKETPKTVEDFNQPLSPASEVLEFFREDLQYAYENLPAQNGSSNTEIGIPARPAAAVMLGTSYLYEKEYDAAKAMFADIIYNSDYGLELESDLTKMFNNSGEFNSESILEVSYSADDRTDMGSWDNNRMVNALGTYSTSITGFLIPAWLVYEYYADPIDPKIADNDNRDVSSRASVMASLVRDQSTPYYITGNSAQYGNFGGQLGQWGYGRYKKYTNHDILEGGETTMALMSGRNIIISRLSDVYLMYAECLLECDDDVQGALDVINAVRKRWNLILLGSSQDASRTYNGYTYDKERVMEHLMYIERPLELSVEGHQIRWQDLRRWGLLEDGDNIFKTLSNKIFYSVYSPNLVGLDGTALTALYPNSYIQKTAGTYTADQTVDYEYDQAYVNYTKARNAYYPIPSTEVMNNSMID